MREMQKVQNVMTRMSHTIGADITIRSAGDMMREFRTHHLPVTQDGQLVGVISDRDIKVACFFQRSGDLMVYDVMTHNPYVVHPNTELDDVVLDMAEQRHRCAIVQSNGKVIGILTDNDALRILGETLRSHYQSPLAQRI